MAGHRTAPRDAWLRQVTSTKRISDAVRVLLLHMGYATDDSGRRRLMDEKGYYRAGRAGLAKALGLSERRATSRLSDAVNAGVLRRAAGGRNGQVVVYQALVFTEDQPRQGDAPRHPGRTADEVRSRVTLSSTLGVTPPVTLASRDDADVRVTTPVTHTTRARLLTDTSAGSANALRTAGQQQDAATTDKEDQDAVPSTGRQDGVEQTAHDVTGGTAAQPVQASPSAVTRGGCPQHPDARTITTSRRTICLACQRAQREHERALREAAWDEWRSPAHPPGTLPATSTTHTERSHP